jgi:polyhydroxyalkanoate synthase subunit PhaC
MMRAATLQYLAEDAGSSVRIGQTPHSVVFRQGKAALRCFQPATVTRAPVFISMPLINTWTVWDLQPHNSVVQAILSTGAPVYLLDWGSPGPEDARLRIEDLVDSLLGRMLDRARRHAGVEELDALGYCVGGTFLALHLARNPAPVRRLCLVCTPIDFHASGRLKTWADPSTFPVDAIVDGLGNFPPEMMQQSFAWLRPLGTWKKYRSLDKRIDQPDFVELFSALEKWNSTPVEFPGEVYRAYVRGCYFENRLMQDDWDIAGRPTSLSGCSIPALTIAGDRDHICPPDAAHALSEVWGGPVEQKTLRGGHVALSLNPAFHEALREWLTA